MGIISNARAVTSSTRKGNSIIRYTHRKGGDILKINPNILPKINVSKNDFGKAGKGISVFFNETDKQLLLCSAVGEGVQTLSGNPDSPEIYCSAIGTGIMDIIGKTVKVNKTVSFDSVAYVNDSDADVLVAVIDLTKYSAAEDAFVLSGTEVTESMASETELFETGV